MPARPKKLIDGRGMTASGVVALILVFTTFALSEKLSTWVWIGFAGLDDALSGVSAVLVCAVALGSLTEGAGADELRRLVGLVRDVRENATELADSMRAQAETAADKRGLLRYAVAVGAFYTFGQQIVNATYEINGVPWFERDDEVHGWAEHTDAWGLVIGIACGFIVAFWIARDLEKRGHRQPAPGAVA